MKFYFYLYWLIISCFFALPIYASEPVSPIQEKLYYEANWAGIHFGKIGIEINQQTDKADVTCDLMSSGILNWFMKHSSHSTLTASGNHFVYPDRIYESHYRTKKKLRYTKLTYKNGKITNEIIEPAESRDKRPAVAEDDKNSAYDLLSFLLKLRNEITNTQLNLVDTFTMRTFDGRRLTQADFVVIGEKTIEIGEENQKTIVIEARRKMLAGYTESELSKYKPDEPSLTIYFSHDEKLIPLRMEVPFFGQYIRADLIKRCSAEESCLLGNQN